MNTSSTSYARYAISIAIVALAAALQSALRPVLGNAEPFTLFYAAVMVSAYVGGLRPGLLSTVLSAGFVQYFWFGVRYSSLHHPEDEISIGLFLVVASFISYLCESLHRARRRAEDALEAAAHEAEGRHYQLHLTKLIADNAAESLFLLDAEGRITFMNLAAERTFQFSPDELMGQVLYDALHHHRADGEPYPSEDCPLGVSLRSGKALTDHEDIFFRKDESTIDVACSNAPLVVDRSVTGAVLVVHDITRRKRAEEERDQLLASERTARGEAERASRMKDEFLSTLSHELRTPLNAILGWAQILRSGEVDHEEVSQGLEVIERNAMVQAQLIEDLLDMSRIVSGKIRFDLKQVSLTEVVEAAVQSVAPLADGKAIALAVFIEEGVHNVKGDSARLQQVVWNLLTNAIKFTPRGGRVELELARAGTDVELIFRDSGQGINPAFMEYVFDRFRQADSSITRKHGGMGLGLAIVKQLVELHGGSVRAYSAGEGRGATFTVTLPLSRDAERASAGNEPAPACPIESLCDSDLRGLKILVVDDEADARELVRLLLRECQATIITAASFGEAIERFEREQPDVLISDIGMPEHDGYELVERLRSAGGQRGETIPAIALTAFARPEDRQRALDAGFQAHVVKPVQAAELISVIASLTGRTGNALSAQS